MEDSEKRKERLKAMRMEAAHVDVSPGVDSSSIHLSNPLAEASTMMPIREESHAPPRFDYYTDPMAAYSGMKRNNADQQIKQDNLSSPRPTSGIHQTDSHQRIFQTQGHRASGVPHMVPRGTANLPSPQMGPRGIVPQFYQGYSPNTWNGYERPPGNSAPLGPMRPPHPIPMHQGAPQPWNRYGGRDNQNFQPRPGPVEGSPSYDCHPHWSNSNTNSGSGRGRGFGRNTTPSLGRTGGRGQAWNSHGHGSSAQSFYDKSMEEDPWQNLEPVLWRSSMKTPASSHVSSDAWLPKSVTTKKPRVSDVSSESNNNAKQSLAEYLAASLNEASREEPSS